jgi:hypothetical protein
MVSSKVSPSYISLWAWTSNHGLHLIESLIAQIESRIALI